ncbi:hypothetical protein BDR03DRAFT_1042831 [Suillus americanus]|nr:hypothetical protein BDR03DRAFT_1042831 [Suillus americanus]
MGNFKHQSIRATDRDRDSDTDREQERDSSVKDGQERLRNLSDKYDRDRRALSSMQQLRGKDRDVASHLGATSSRLASQSQQAPSNRQLDSREPSKKKDGSDNPWRDRDEDDRDHDRRGNRNEHRKEAAGYRRDRDDCDLDRESEVDDPHRWRDNGKCDEHMSARRDREQRDRE